MARAEAPLSAQDPTAAADAAATEVPPEIVAQSLGEWFQAWLVRIRSGDSGVLPVLLGMVIITIVFESISPSHVFLSAPNLVNLFQQSAVFMVLAMGEIFALLLGEIDLSIGYVGATGAAIAVQLVQPATTKWPWWGALVVALLVCAVIGAIQGTLITRLRLSSLIVTLAGGLIFQGVTLIILLLGPFSGYPGLTGTDPNKQVLYNLMWGTIDPVISWIGAAVIVIAIAAFLWTSDDRRRRSGLVAPPVSLTLLKIAVIAIAAAVVVGICNTNRAALGTLEGVPWVIPIVLVVFGAWMLLLQKTRFGRYVYAIGGNREAARRAGIKVPVIITWCFTISAFTAGIGALLFASNGGGMSNNFPGAALVLYAIAAAVIGGTGLFGGRGKVLHGILGGLVIGGIYNGLYLLTIPVQWQYIVIGLVLLAAVTIDALSRRSATAGGRV